jgi:hypothetical protein
MSMSMLHGHRQMHGHGRAADAELSKYVDGGSESRLCIWQYPTVELYWKACLI